MHEGVEEHGVGVVRDLLQLLLHPLDDVVRDLARALQAVRAAQEQLGPVRDELGSLARQPIVEVDRLDLGRDVAEPDRLEQVAELGADERIAALAAIGGLVLALLAFRFAGFLGVGLLGLLIGFAAVNYDLSKSDVGGGFPSPSLYAKQVAAREQMSQDEKLAYQAGLRALWRPLTVARTLSVGMIALGFGGYLLLG